MLSVFEKGTDSTDEYPVPNELCELYLPWTTAPQQAASPAALQDVTEDTRRKKQEQHKKRRINRPTALIYYPGERCLGRRLRCCRRSESMGVMDNLSPIYI